MAEIPITINSDNFFEMMAEIPITYFIQFNQ